MWQILASCLLVEVKCVIAGLKYWRTSSGRSAYLFSVLVTKEAACWDDWAQDGNSLNFWVTTWMTADLHTYEICIGLFVRNKPLLCKASIIYYCSIHSLNYSVWYRSIEVHVILFSCCVPFYSLFLLNPLCDTDIAIPTYFWLVCSAILLIIPLFSVLCFI